MFEYDPATHRLVDPMTGDELRTLDAHWQSDVRTIGIFSSDGVQKFAVALQDYSIDEPGTWPKDKVTRVILLHADAYDSEGQPKAVAGPHPQIDRLVAHFRSQAMSKPNFVAFEFVDRRNAKGAR